MIYVTLFWIFFRIGLFGYGGGLGMLPLIFQSVHDYNLLDKESFSNLVAVSQITPGPIAVNAATFVGFLNGGVFGSFIATLAVSIPAFALVLIAMKFMDTYEESIGLEGIKKGVRPVTAGLVASAVIFLAETSLVNCSIFSSDMITDFNNSINLIPCAICTASVILNGPLRMHPIIVILIMGVLGAFLCC